VNYFTNSKPKIEAGQVRNIWEVFSLIKEPLAQVAAQISQQAAEFDPAIEPYVSNASEAHGKQIRPALVLLTAGAFGPIAPEHIRIGVILEMIHLATLVHDDNVDGADLRRNQAGPKAHWVDATSVLLGDRFFTRAIEMSTQFESSYICRRVVLSVKEVCSGEIIQAQRHFDLKLKADDYFKVLEMKPAALFASATELGALLAGASPQATEAMRVYGTKLGIACQVYDDCLDLVGDEKEAGKSLRMDLKKGKLTLPLLNLLEASDSKERDRISDMILNGGEPEFDEIAQLVRSEGALHQALETGRSFVASAQSQLTCLPANRYSEALDEIGHVLISRLNRFEADRG